MVGIRGPLAQTGRASSGVAPNQSGSATVNLWSDLLDSVASGKRLPEKHIILLGGSPSTQKDFLETLESDNVPQSVRKLGRRAPVANDFALGYTYQDILDADQEDTLARLSVHTIAGLSPAFSHLVNSLLRPAFIPEALVIILLDWAEPWKWAQQLQAALTLLHRAVEEASPDAQSESHRIMQLWQQRKLGNSYDIGAGSKAEDEAVAVPLGSGEWDFPLGLPIAVVCHNADKIDILEHEHGWHAEEFDFVAQYLRTVLLKHGASLVYTSSSVPNSISLLVQSCLGVRSTLQRQILKHDVVNRDKILIPPNWDSWGKVRVLREGFDVEGLSRAWGELLELQMASRYSEDGEDTKENGKPDTEGLQLDPFKVYEEFIKDPHARSNARQQQPSNKLDMPLRDMQAFLMDQLEVADRMKAEDERAQAENATNGRSKVSTADGMRSETSGIETDLPYGTGRVHDHIGPVQLNVGGVQVDADDVLRRIQDRTHASDATSSSHGPSTPVNSSKDARSGQNEALASFFAGLLKRGGPNSPANNNNNNSAGAGAGNGNKGS